MPLVRFKRKTLIEEIGMYVFPNLTEKDLRHTAIWPFYRKMRVRCWKPLEHIVEISKENGRVKSCLTHRFKHDRTNRILNMHTSKHEMMYFVVVDGPNVYQSPLCASSIDLYKELCKFLGSSCDIEKYDRELKKVIAMPVKSDYGKPYKIPVG